MTNKKLKGITKIIAHSGSFDFLKKELDLYNKKDLKKKYE